MKNIMFGICQWNLPTKGYKGVYEIKKLGLEGMELDFTRELRWNMKKYRKASKETGILFPTLGLNIFCQKSYTYPGSERFFERTVAKALACAVKLDVKTLQIPAFFASDIVNDEALRMAAKNLKKACEMAEPFGINIGTENALDADQNQKLFQLVNHPLFRFYFDNQNLWRMKGKSCLDVLAVMKDQIIEAHAKDSRVINGEAKWFPLGEGDAEFAPSMNFLKENNYSGWIHLENDYQLDPNYEEAIKKDLNTILQQT